MNIVSLHEVLCVIALLGVGLITKKIELKIRISKVIQEEI